MTCETCGQDAAQTARERQVSSARLMHYRIALYLACGGDQVKVLDLMEQAESTKNPEQGGDKP